MSITNTMLPAYVLIAANSSSGDAHFVSGHRIIFIALLFLLMMIYFFLMLRREREEKIDPVIAAAGKPKKWIHKKADELEKEGEFKGAGDLFMMLDRFEDAAKAYIHGKALGRAADAFLKMGDKYRAAKAYEKRGMYLRAAELYRESNKFQDAARTFGRAGNDVLAAEVLEKSRQFGEAAEIYRKTNHLRKAGEIKYKAGDRLGAAQSLEEAFREEADRLPGDMKPSDSRMLAHLAFLIGNFYEQENKADEAAAAYESGGHLAEAARIHERVGRYPLAAQLYLTAGRPLEAAIAEDKSGRKQEAALIRAEAYRQRGQYLEAVGNYEIAGKSLEAAQMYCELGEHGKAARMYERAEKNDFAADEYIKAGEKDLAAAAFEKAKLYSRAADIYGEEGNPSKQAQMLEAANQFLMAGRMYREAGGLENAIRAFQRIGDSDPEFEQAQIALGDIFREKGIPKIAMQYYRRVLNQKPVDRSNMEAYYHLGLCHETVGFFHEALKIYEAIVVIDYHFADIPDRIRLLEEKLPASTPGTPSEPSIPSIYDSTLVGDSEATQTGASTAPRMRRYELIEEIGRGGMGIVYKARDTVLDRIVAYKVLPANLREHPQAVKNFFREAKSAAALNHPNIVTVHDAGEEDGNYYIAMEHLKGKTIKQMLNQDGAMPLKAVVFTVGQVLRALSYAHSRNIVHRDIKSSNIMWTEDRVAKLMDFGLAKIVEGYKHSQTVMSGTPYYMSPEQTVGGKIDHRTDIYSLGVMIFEMVTGQLPFTDGQAAYHHVHTPPPRPVDVFPNTPQSVNDLILKMMAKNPDERYQNAEEALESLKIVAMEIKDSVDRPEV